MPSPRQRETKILEYLQKKKSASIQELAARLSVSPMTIHRDLNRLVAMGHVQKSHGEVALTTAHLETGGCVICGKTMPERTAFIINLENGERKRACCAHCGLMLHAQMGGMAMTTDFLHNHIVSANQATYLLRCELTVCCAPSVLSFASRQEAEKFQKGFGGQLTDMAEAIRFLHRGVNAA